MIETQAQRAAREKREAPIRAARAAAHAEKMGTPPPTPPTKAVTGIPATDIIERIIADPNGQFTALTAKTITKRIKDGYNETVRLLSIAHDRGVWKLLGYETWEAYVKKEFDFSRQRGYQLLDHSRTVNEVTTVVDISLKERQTRPLKGLPKADKVKALKAAVKTAGGKAPTGKQVAAAVAEMKPAKVTEVSTQPALQMVVVENSNPPPDCCYCGKPVIGTVTGMSVTRAGYSHPKCTEDVKMAADQSDPSKPIEHDITTDTRTFEARYTELLQAVESVVPGETRHQTALRYIRDAEADAQILASRTKV